MLLRVNRQYEKEAHLARARRARRRHRPDPAPPRGARVRRPARHGLGPGHPVRPHAHARRAAGRALRPRRGGGPASSREEWSPHRPAARAPRGGRLPRPPPHPRPRSSAWPASWPTARPRSACCSPTASTRASGTGSSTTRRPTPSSRRSRASPTANVTTVPFHLDQLDAAAGAAVAPSSTAAAGGTGQRRAPRATPRPAASPSATRRVGVVPGLHARSATSAGASTCTIAGRVRSMRVAPQHDAPTLELVLVDGTGGISVVFLGRRAIAGVDVGTRMLVEGTVGVHKARLALLNPSYQLLAVAAALSRSDAAGVLDEVDLVEHLVELVAGLDGAEALRVLGGAARRERRAGSSTAWGGRTARRCSARRRAPASATTRWMPGGITPLESCSSIIPVLMITLPSGATASTQPSTGLHLEARARWPGAAR